MSRREVKSIVIIGGGTAGWLTAGILASRLRTRVLQKELTITLCESPNIPTVGVGEGTWPTMPSTLSSMGISETEFIRECDVSFKQGSKFVNWGSDKQQNYYYHPFEVPIGSLEGLLPEYWIHNTNQGSLSQLFTTQEQLCEHNIAPKAITHAEYAKAANYGYHLNAGKFAGFLQKHCVNKLGVQHVLSEVTDVNLSVSGDIQSVVLSEKGELSGDLFVDCTGFQSLLLGQTLGVKFKSVKHLLFADTALATQVQYPTANHAIKPYTQSTAQEAGWIWDIGLPSRRGVGHVFSSKYTDLTSAQDKLLKYIQETGGDDKSLEIRKINFEAGHREKFWHKNCVAVGLSAGFLEPLEASALVLVELSAMMIADQLPPTHGVMHIAQQRFNRTFHYRWGGLLIS